MKENKDITVTPVKWDYEKRKWIREFPPIYMYRFYSDDKNTRIVIKNPIPKNVIVCGRNVIYE